jgi:hypothetical protein
MKAILKQLLLTAVITGEAGIHPSYGQCTLFSEGFASAFGSQFTSTGLGGSAWAFTGSCAASNLSGHSAPGSVIFQGTTVPCQFGNSTSTVSGNLNSPGINISASGTTTLNFNYYLLNECTGTCPNDKLSVSISTNGGSTYTPIMDSYSVGGLAPTAGSWVAKSYNLSAYGGQNIMIRFSFNSVNGTANAFDGVYLDDITVTATAGPAMPSSISGNAWACMNTSATYSISPVTAASTYTWSVPAGASITAGQGTTSVSVAFGTTSGNVSVAAVNACGASTAQTLSVSVSVPSLSASAASTSICEGDTAQLYAYSNLQGDNFVESFDPTIVSQWTAITGGNASSTCGSVNGNALYFDGTGTRAATTDLLNAVGGGVVNFYLKIASGTSPCEDADAGENIVLEYSINGGAAWTNLNTYVTTLYSTFTSLSESIPVAAQTPNTIFRWRQLSHSGSGFDNWVMDDVNIVLSSSSAYNWAPSAHVSNPAISNPQAWPTVTTTYTVTTSGSCGSVSDEVTITVNPTVQGANAGSDKTICEGWNAVLNGSSTGGTDYLWSTGQTTSSISVSPSVSSTYTLVVSNSSGCSQSDEVMVAVNSAATANAGPDPAICSGQTILLNGNGNGSYSWSPQTGLTCPTCASTGANPAATTTYTLTATNNCGSVSDEVTVTVGMATANSGNDVTICPNGSTLLNGAGNGSYSWSPAAGLSCTTCANPVASPSATTTYTLIATGNCGSASDEVVVTVDPSATANANAGSDATICSNASTILNGVGSGSFNWVPAAGLSCTTCANPVASPTTTTTYTLMVTSTCGNASDEVKVTLDSSATVTANAGNDVTICANDSTVLNAAGNGTYSWSPATGLSCTGCANPVASPTTTTTYTLMVTSSCGNASDEALVTVDPCVTGMTGSLHEEEINIAPNPGAGLFVLTTSETIYGELNIQIMNIQGELIYRAEQTMQSKESIKVDISDASAGIYFLKLTTGNRTMMRKIVISNQ